MSGSVVHFEIPAEDLGRAQGFYRDAFGWAINPMPEMHYTMVSTGPVGEDMMPTERGMINGGMFERTGNLTAPIVTIGVDDLEASLRKVEELGGKTVQGKMPVGDMGFAAYFADTEGNTVGLWQNAG
jgi:predicted enzyme related to lactoylglutathione lyase